MIDLLALPIFPCNLAKEPLTAHGFKDAKRGARGWKAWPLVGFPTGARSGFDVLDVDPRGREWFDENFDALPTTLAHETQRGLHLLFKHAKGLGCSSGKIAEGIDVRSTGGYAIYWPATGLPIDDHPVCEWPDWLLAEAMDKRIGTPSKKNIDRGDGYDPVCVGDRTAALRQMSAEDWNGEHDDWFELLMACKYVGITLDDFVEWCVSDPDYANDAEIIARKWHSVVPKHGGAFWRELSKRKIRVEGKGDNNERARVPNLESRLSVNAFQPSRSPDARLNYICKKIAEKLTPQQARCAIEALPYETPKLSATAITTMDSFPEALERAIIRSGIKPKALPPPKVINGTVEQVSPEEMKKPFQRYRRF